jgi:hypothetical protein
MKPFVILIVAALLIYFAALVYQHHQVQKNEICIDSSDGARSCIEFPKSER